MGATTYKIKQGDTLSGISQRTGVSVADIAKANGISNPNKIYAGATIKIPTNPKMPIGVGGNGVNATSPKVGGATVVKGSSPSNTNPKKEDDNPYTDMDLSQYDSGYKKSDDVLAAEKKKSDAENAVSSYGNYGYGKQGTLDEVINKILNREEFSYDLNGDALYQQYKDKYIQQGKMAMQDTMGQAAAMTGGYGNSYAATAGNQAYQAHLENLNDVIPELYQMALDKYNQEGQDLYNQYSMLSDDKSMDYGMWSDKYNQLVADRDYYGNEANNAFNKDFGIWSDQRDYDTNQYWNETNWGYGQEQDKIANAKSDAWSMIQAGVMPSDDALEAAGISKEDAEAVAGVYEKQIEGSESSDDSEDSGKMGKLNNLTTSQYNNVMSTIDNYVSAGNMQGLESYLNGLVNRGWLSEEEATDIWDQYNTEESGGQIDTSVDPMKMILSPKPENGNSLTALQNRSLNRLPLGNNITTTKNTTPEKKKVKSNIRFTR